MAQVIVNGLLIGGVYSMVAVGLTVIFGVMKIINFAQGEFLMLGMYLTFFLYPLFGLETNPYPLIIPVALGMFAIGTVIFKTTISKVVGKGDSNYIVLTLGLSYLIQNLVQFVFGAEFHALSISNSLKFGTVSVAGLILPLPRIIAFGAAAIAVVLMTYFLNKTDMGRAMRSTSEDRTIAALLGVNTDVIYTLAFGMGTVFAGLSGLLLTPMFNIQPRAGVLFSTIGMTVVVLGGLGNIKGAMIGGLIIGLVESFASVYINLEMAPVAIDLTLLLVLMLRPYGLFGGGVRKA
ncbi:MAG: branched-chain amino acid ABC transporter permease [Christensenellales bacterium]|jgi:branched-chain amino acid transport system permease protein